MSDPYLQNKQNAAIVPHTEKVKRDTKRASLIYSLAVPLHSLSCLLVLSIPLFSETPIYISWYCRSLYSLKLQSVLSTGYRQPSGSLELIRDTLELPSRIALYEYEYPHLYNSVLASSPVCPSVQCLCSLAPLKHVSIAF